MTDLTFDGESNGKGLRNMMLASHNDVSTLRKFHDNLPVAMFCLEPDTPDSETLPFQTELKPETRTIELVIHQILNILCLRVENESFRQNKTETASNIHSAYQGSIQGF